MRFPKTLTACCLLAGVTATVTFAQDSDAQQKALEALRQFTAEKEGRTSKGLTTEPAASTDDAAAKELEEKARQSVSQPEPTPATTAAPVDETEKERKAREALDDLRRSDPTPQGNTATVVVTEGDSAGKEEALRKALDAQYSTEPAAPTASAVATTSMPQTSQPATAAAAAKPATMAKPAPKTQKEKLNDLLELYMANSITPREYHDQRATILAGK